MRNRAKRYNGRRLKKMVPSTDKMVGKAEHLNLKS